MTSDTAARAGTLTPTSTHWGSFLVEKRDGRIAAIHPHHEDSDPSPIGQSLVDACDPNCRIAQPAIRQGYLQHRHKSDGSGRGN